jgi:murein L,D-transpeptidase YcbB/YkuD
MDKGTQNALLYTAGLAAVYLGYKYYKKQQGLVQQAPSTTAGNLPMTTPAAMTQAAKAPVSKAPASPTFGGSSSAYVAKVKILQTLVGVKADGIIGPITQKAAATFGVNYPINATNVDKAIATVTTAKSKAVVTFPWWTKK